MKETDYKDWVPLDRVHDRTERRVGGTLAGYLIKALTATTFTDDRPSDVLLKWVKGDVEHSTTILLTEGQDVQKVKRGNYNYTWSLRAEVHQRVMDKVREVEEADEALRPPSPEDLEKSSAKKEVFVKALQLPSGLANDISHIELPTLVGILYCLYASKVKDPQEKQDILASDMRLPSADKEKLSQWLRHPEALTDLVLEKLAENLMEGIVAPHESLAAIVKRDYKKPPELSAKASTDIVPPVQPVISNYEAYGAVCEYLKISIDSVLAKCPVEADEKPYTTAELRNLKNEDAPIWGAMAAVLIKELSTEKTPLATPEELHAFGSWLKGTKISAVDLQNYLTRNKTGLAVTAICKKMKLYAAAIYSSNSRFSNSRCELSTLHKAADWLGIQENAAQLGLETVKDIYDLVSKVKANKAPVAEPVRTR